MIVSPEHSIILSLLADQDNSLIAQLRDQISRIFDYRSEVVPLLRDVDFALDPGRNQYNSTIILEELAVLAPAHAVKVLAIVEVDLFIPILTHVYGEAQIGGKACIVSTYRLKQGVSLVSNPQAYHHRVAREAIHELGHTFGLRHCPDNACLMHYCRTTRDVDRKLDEFCRYCKVLLDDELKTLVKE